MNTRMANQVLLLSLTGCALVSVSIWYLCNRRADERPKVTLEWFQEKPVTVVSGQTYLGTMQLTNHSKEEILLTDSRTSCGCALPFVNGRPLSDANVVLKPGASTAVTVQVATHQRVGPSAFTIAVKCSDPRESTGEFWVEDSVDLDIRSGWVSSPSSVTTTIENDNREFQIYLYDDVDAPHLEIGLLQTSNSNVLKCVAKPIGSGEIDRQLYTNFGQNLTPRYILNCELNIDRARAGAYRIIVYSTQNDVNPIEIPIVLNEPEKEFRMQPATLTISSSNSGQCTRMVSLISKDPIIEEISVNLEARFVQVDLVRSERLRREYRVTIDQVDHWRDIDITFANSRGIIASLPIRKLETNVLQSLSP